MGFKDAGWALNVRLPPRDTDAKTAVKSVLLAICLHTDDKNNQTVIGQESLAEELDISVRTVRRAVGVLDDLGVIQRERRYAEGGGTARAIESRS